MPWPRFEEDVTAIVWIRQPVAPEACEQPSPSWEKSRKQFTVCGAIPSADGRTAAYQSYIAPKLELDATPGDARARGA